jgi:hypothetical protein
LESKIENQADALEQTRKQLQTQLTLNTKLDKKLEQTQQELDKLVRENMALESQERIKLTILGLIILAVGWVAGFVTGFFKRQAEDKRFIKMMVEANSLKKQP